jgi:hypothetical protein
MAVALAQLFFLMRGFPPIVVLLGFLSGMAITCAWPIVIVGSVWRASRRRDVDLLRK